jgi:tryptophan 2,3-dioxygenase
MTKRKPTAYWDYIKVDELLGLQTGIADSEASLGNDEVMFITVHQIDELWFKLILRELVSVRDLFAKAPVPEQALASAVRGLRRIEVLLHHIAHHFSLMETMTTRDYLGFRDKLTPASGFQSAQMREIEILLGLPDAERIPLGREASYMHALRNADGSASSASQRVEARLSDKPTVRDAIREWLHRTPIQGSLPDQADDQAHVGSFIEAYCAAHARASRLALELARTDKLSAEETKRLEDRYEKEILGARAFLLAEDTPEADRARASRVRAALVFIESYRELPLLAWPREVIDAVVSLEQAFVIFRQRHARMVERVIGRRTGTGGSSGVDYLDQTALKYRVFNDVWAVRTILVEKALLPALEKAELYAFSAGT